MIIEKDLRQENYYIDGLLKQDKKVINEIYQEIYPYLSSWIVANQGNKDDVWDIFGEAILIIYQKSLQGFKVKSNFKSYFFGICKNLWLNKLRKQKQFHFVSSNKEADNIEDKENIEQAILLSERHKLFTEKFNILSDKCKKLIDLISNGIALKDIAQKTGMTPDFTKQKSFRCRKKLTELIKEDPRYNELSL